MVAENTVLRSDWKPIKTELDYEQFLKRKSQIDTYDGFDPVFMPDSLFDFQRALVDWAVRKGRAAIFSDCGTGKTVMQLTWAENVARHTGGKVLILTPLAVAPQTVEEGEKFGVEVIHEREGVAQRITVTNYERLHYFNPTDFVGVVCDESSCIKSFDGKRRGQVTDFMRKLRYRLLCTATAAPNDYTELGTSSEALGYLGLMDMLGKFFKNDQNTSKPVRRWTAQKTGWATATAGCGRSVWRLKGHAETHFWRWVCSWARALRKPSDLGFDDGRFVLPALNEEVHIIQPRTIKDGYLFEMPAVGLHEEREEARRTIQERCEKAASLVNNTGQPALVWCHLNDEGKLLKQLIPDAVEVCGSDSEEKKEEALIGFSHGKFRVLITKQKIAGWGLNWQHCNHMTFFPSHSFEAYYQGVRRCWRFGQKNPVKVDIVATPGSALIQENLENKSKAADIMFDRLVEHMNDALNIQRQNDYQEKMEIPSWL